MKRENKIESIISTLDIFDAWYFRFEHVQSDNSIYIYSKEDIKIIILVFVNNITFISKDDFAITFTV